jgi:hypothetical protein
MKNDLGGGNGVVEIYSGGNSGGGSMQLFPYFPVDYGEFLR